MTREGYDREVSGRRKVLFALVATVAIVLGVAAWRVLPMFTGPALPPGATRLHIVTAGPTLTFGCAAGLLSPVRIEASGDELVLVAVESGTVIPVRWPSGFGAWRVGGRAVLADPWGTVVGREGDVLDTLSGGLGTGDIFTICPFGIVSRARSTPASDSAPTDFVPDRTDSRQRVRYVQVVREIGLPTRSVTFDTTTR